MKSLFDNTTAVFDGAFGTMLMQKGLDGLPEGYNLTNPSAVASIHRAYAEAGATHIEANTFGANALKLAKHGLSNRAKEIAKTGILIARDAAPNAKIVATVGSCGVLPKPLGEGDFEAFERIFSLQLEGIAEGSPDGILLETFSSFYELKCALLLAKKIAPELPVIASLCFTNGRTLMGAPSEVAIQNLCALPTFAVASNCAGGTKEFLPLSKTFARVSSKPFLLMPNAGMPVRVNGEVTYPESPQDFVRGFEEIFASNPAAVGGCCGTTPEHIRLLSAIAKNNVPKAPEPQHDFLSSERTLFFGTPTEATITNCDVDDLLDEAEDSAALKTDVSSLSDDEIKELLFEFQAASACPLCFIAKESQRELVDRCYNGITKIEIL